MPLGDTSLGTLIALFTSGTVQVRSNGPFTSWHMKIQPVTKIATGRHLATSLDAFQSKSAAAYLDAWRTSFTCPLSQGHHFLPLKGSIKNLL